MGSQADGGAGKRAKPPQMSTGVLLHSLGLGHHAATFEKAGFMMIEPNTKWLDIDVEDILMAVEARSGETFSPEDRVELWKALRFMWFRGPGHDVPFIEPSEVPPLFLPKRDARQMDTDAKFATLEPDRQRQVMRKMTLVSGGILTQVQFETYRRQTDIFYELKDLQRSVAEWQRMNPRKMLREDPREEAMKVRIRRMLDHASDFIQDRKAEKSSLRYEGNFFFLCQLSLVGMALLMFITGYKRYEFAPKAVFWEFFFSSKQFLTGIVYFMAFIIAYAVADRYHGDDLEKRYQRMIISLERLVEEISAFRVETDELRMEEHEAIRQQMTAAIGEAQRRAKKQGVGGQPRKRRKKKKVDDDISAWAPNVKIDNQAELHLKIIKGIEESYKRLPPLPDGFRRQGGDRMHQHRGVLGGISEDVRHIKAFPLTYDPTGDVQNTAPPALAAGPSRRALPMPLRPPLPPPLEPSVFGGTPPSRSPVGITPLGTTADSGFMGTKAVTPQAQTLTASDVLAASGERGLLRSAGSASSFASAPPSPLLPPPPPVFSMSASVSLADSTLADSSLRRAPSGTWPSGAPVGGLPPTDTATGNMPRGGPSEVDDTSAERNPLRTVASDAPNFGAATSSRTPPLTPPRTPPQTTPRSQVGDVRPPPLPHPVEGASGADGASLPPSSARTPLPGEMPEPGDSA